MVLLDSYLSFSSSRVCLYIDIQFLIRLAESRVNRGDLAVAKNSDARTIIHEYVRRDMSLPEFTTLRRRDDRVKVFARHTFFRTFAHCEGCSCATCGDSIRTFLHCPRNSVAVLVTLRDATTIVRCAHRWREIELLIDVICAKYLAYNARKCRL